VVTSRALTDNEQWQTMQRGEFRVFKNGKSQAF